MSITTAHVAARVHQEAGVEQTMALVEKAQQLAGHFPDAEALGRARRVLNGELSAERAYDQLAVKYAQG